MTRDTASKTKEDKAEICRFYEELVSRILEYKNMFTNEQWTRTSKVASNPAPARTWTVSPGGSTIYTVYSDRSLQMAWDAVEQSRRRMGDDPAGRRRKHHQRINRRDAARQMRERT